MQTAEGQTLSEPVLTMEIRRGCANGHPHPLTSHGVDMPKCPVCGAPSGAVELRVVGPEDTLEVSQ